MSSNRRYSLPDVINIAPGSLVQQNFSPLALVVDIPSPPFDGQAEMSSAYGSWSRRITTTGGHLVSGDLIGTNLQLSKALEDKITAPSGREVLSTSRRALSGRVGRGGAGNAISTSDESQHTTEQILRQERHILRHYKQNSVPDYKTGRGGAGAKGHVNIRGKVPNQERALAKERYVQMKWKAEKELKGGIKTGRGGRGNIVKVNEEGLISPMKGSTSKSPFGNSSLDRRRRNRLSLNSTPSIISADPASSRPSHGDLHPPTSLAYHWDYAETIYDLDSEISITTAGPSTILAPSTARFQPSPTPTRLPNDVAPFHEPIMPPPSDTPQPTGRPREMQSKVLTTDAVAKRPNSLFRSFKKLNLGKSKEEKQPNHPDIPDILDITLQISRQSSTNSSDIDTSMIQHARKTYITPASAALSMVDASVRYHAFPPRDIGPTIVSLYAGMEGSRISSDRSEDGVYTRPRAESGTSVSSGRSLPLPSPPLQQPVIAMQINSPAKNPGPPRRSRPLPIPPVSAHSVLHPSTPRNLPSPPDTPPVNISQDDDDSNTLPIYSPFPVTGCLDHI